MNEKEYRQYVLSSAYDMLPVNIVLPQDREELALTLNGKKMNLRRNDFLKFAEASDIEKKAAIKMMKRLMVQLLMDIHLHHSLSVLENITSSQLMF